MPIKVSSSDSKFRQVAAHLRGRIVKGELAVGSQLPTWDRLESEYGVGRATLMRAMSRLKRQGFVYSASTRGTYVSKTPPHLSRFGLVFGEMPESFNRFWTTLLNQSRVIAEHHDIEIEPFYGISGHADSKSDQQLARELAEDRLAGLIVVAAEGIFETPVLREADVPMCIIGHGGPTGAPRLWIDHKSFVTRSLDWLEAKHRQSVAVLTNLTDRFESITERIASRGMFTKSSWLQHASAGRPIGARNIMQLLFDVDSRRLPDAVIVTDDNLVEDALNGLIQAGVRVGHDVDVVVHCNWPWPVRSVLPVKRLGFDANEFLNRALSSFQQLRDGEPVEQDQLIPAVFEDEVQTAPRYDDVPTFTRAVSASV